MQLEDQTFESETWQGEYLETWPRLPLGLRRHLARLAPPEAFQLILSDGNDEVFEAFLENPKITQAEVLVLIDRARTMRTRTSNGMPAIPSRGGYSVILTPPSVSPVGSLTICLSWNLNGS